MAKLHPPVIPGTIPAFSGTSIEVPFSMSRAVSPSEISGLILKLKRVNGNIIGTATTGSFTSPAAFNVQNFGLTYGEFYKVQLAYIKKENGEIGHYSTVGVVKYTSKPDVFIEGLNPYASNGHSYVYTGVYRQAKYDSDLNKYDTEDYDTSEKLYSSRFYLYDENYRIIKDSGEILHNATQDIAPYEASDVFEYYEDFNENETRFLQYEITTSNNMKIKTPYYKLSQHQLPSMILNAHLEVKNDFETGTIQVDLVAESETAISGIFALSRASSRDPQKWELMKEFTLQAEVPNKVLFTDYTVEQGITYRYSLQQYNEHGLYSERKISESVIADFEDIFLYDGKRQLPVRFNPKVSTFKQNLIEQKTETIGNKYPFIIKNGAVNYKELAISGLISYQMDALETFMSKDDIELSYNKYDNKRYDIHDLVTDNIKAERLFKTEVLSWLSNGEIKLYRSPTEGNFIVRLMNVTTSPTEQLGRLLHTFNCAAYEMAEPTYQSLIKYNIIAPENNEMSTMRWKTVDLRAALKANAESATPQKIIQLNIGKVLGINTILDVYSVSFEGLDPGSYFLLGNSADDCQKIYIGVTGSYRYSSNTPISYVAIPAPAQLPPFDYDSFLTFGYKGWVRSSFDLITSVQVINQAGHRFTGNAYSIYNGDNILDYLNNIKDTVLAIKYIKLFSREIKPLYCEGNPEAEGQFYLSENNSAHGGTPYSYADLINHVDKFALYKLYEVRKDYQDYVNEGYYLDKSFKETKEYLKDGVQLYYDPMRVYEIGEGFITAENSQDLYNVQINEETTNMYEIFTRTYQGIENVEYLSIGPGVVLDIGYDMQRFTYNFENEDETIREERIKMEAAQQAYEREKFRKIETIGDVNVQLRDTNNKYKEFKNAQRAYLVGLKEAILNYKKENHLNE